MFEGRIVSQSFAAVLDSIDIVSGTPRGDAVSIYSVIRNEMYFLPALLSHYRAMGIEQFLFLDDASDDGSRQYLVAQPDCVVLRSALSFGDAISASLPEGGTFSGRAGTLLKRAIAHRFLMGQYALYVDADEFLILPSRFPSMTALYTELKARNIASVAANLVDFYPAGVADLEASHEFGSFDELLAHTPWFDASPLVRIEPGAQPRSAGPSASTRLFRQFAVHEAPPVVDFLPDWLVDALPFPPPRAAWYKTPIIRWTPGTFMVGSHLANVPPHPDLILAIAHFKFTSDLRRRVDAAIARKSHARKSGKYRQYNKLLQRMREGSGSFLGPLSRHYTGPDDLLECGLIVDRAAPGLSQSS